VEESPQRKIQSQVMRRKVHLKGHSFHDPDLYNLSQSEFTRMYHLEALW